MLIILLYITQHTYKTDDRKGRKKSSKGKKSSKTKRSRPKSDKTYTVCLLYSYCTLVDQ